MGICFLPEPFVQAEASQGLLWPLLPKTQSFTSDIYVITLAPECVQLPTRLFRDVLEQLGAGR